MNSKKNIGFVDQMIRTLLILDLVVPCLLGLTTGVVAYLMIGTALMLTVTCATGHCWVYSTLNLTTRQ